MTFPLSCIIRSLRYLWWGQKNCLNDITTVFCSFIKIRKSNNICKRKKMRSNNNKKSFHCCKFSIKSNECAYNIILWQSNEYHLSFQVGTSAAIVAMVALKWNKSVTTSHSFIFFFIVFHSNIYNVTLWIHAIMSVFESVKKEISSMNLPLVFPHFTFFQYFTIFFQTNQTDTQFNEVVVNDVK